MANNRLMCWLFLRLVGLIYFVAFASIGLQINGLLGSNGLLPAASFLPALFQQYGLTSYWLVPTIFWLNHSDLFLQIISWLGAILGLTLLLGLEHPLLLTLLYLGYLSLVSVGQDFMAFQWDILLLEVGFLAIFVNSSSNLMVWLFRWLLFRLMFLSGAMKLLSGDPTWWNLSALDYHFETQPLPTVLGWYAHQLPRWLHEAAVGAMFITELMLPFLFFVVRPRWLRYGAAGATLLLQTLIFLTGNYTFFNLLTLVLCLWLFDEASFARVMPQRLVNRLATRRPNPSFALGAVRVLAGVIIFISSFQLWGIFFGNVPQPVGVILKWVAPLRLVNSYGLFAVMTTVRPEIIIEGSQDGETWQEYEFKYKPGDLYRPPGWIAPFQPRLDWQMWFAALGDYPGTGWFVNLMARLGQGSPEVLVLLAKNPFPEAPPKYLRAWLYRYHFTDLTTLHTEGMWWRRERIGLYYPLPAILLNPQPDQKISSLLPIRITLVTLSDSEESPSRNWRFFGFASE